MARFLLGAICVVISVVLSGCGLFMPDKNSISTCTMHAADLKPFRGLRLDVPLQIKPDEDDNYHLTPELTIKKSSELGVIDRMYSIYFPGQLDLVPSFVDKTGLEGLHLTTLDGSLARYEVRYVDDSLKTDSQAQTLEKVANALGMQKGDFFYTTRSEWPQAVCADFDVYIQPFKMDTGDLKSSTMIVHVIRKDLDDIVHERYGRLRPRN